MLPDNVTNNDIRTEDGIDAHVGNGMTLRGVLEGMGIVPEYRDGYAPRYRDGYYSKSARQRAGRARSFVSATKSSDVIELSDCDRRKAVIRSGCIDVMDPGFDWTDFPAHAHDGNPAKFEPGITYAASGVDVAAADAVVERIKPLAKATRRFGSMAGLGGFASVFDLKALNYADPLLVTSCDGVGTKVRLAAQHGGKHLRSIGADLVAMVANDIVTTGAEPLVFLDYYASGQLDVEIMECVVAGIADACCETGMELAGGETAIMPGMYGMHPNGIGEFDLAGFAAGVVERPDLLPDHDGSDGMMPGDALVVLPSRGLHSNGFALVNALIDAGRIDTGDDAVLDALMAPTRLYVAPLRRVLWKFRGAVKALAHITGGGMAGNICRVLPADLTAVVDLDRIAVPGVYGIMFDAGVSESEMLATYNCGAGMVAVCRQDDVDAVCEFLCNDAGTDAYVAGRVDERGAGDPAVRFEGTLARPAFQASG